MTCPVAQIACSWHHATAGSSPLRTLLLTSRYSLSSGNAAQARGVLHDPDVQNPDAPRNWTLSTRRALTSGRDLRSPELAPRDSRRHRDECGGTPRALSG